MSAFFVKGRPVPQGSLTFMRGRPIHARAADLAAWRADIARLATGAGYRPIQGGVKVSCQFVYNRPKSAATRGMPWVKPDLDKLVRAVLDGLTGVAYDDDCQVVLISASKVYGAVQGVWIEIEQISA